jgi:aminoglycoside phosphotransferase (APT) family kinase protein
MPDNEVTELSKDKAQAALDIISPASVVKAIRGLHGSFSNYTHLVEFQNSDGSKERIVIRRYAKFHDYDRGEKAIREFKTYQLLEEHDFPAPRPLYLDKDGQYLGLPGIVTTYTPGKLIQTPREPLGWARALASTLAQIHSIPCNPTTQSFLLDANSEATWFIRPGEPPDYMKVHPLGSRVCWIVAEMFPHLQSIQPGLVHIDYWPGNVLWSQGRISAVVDWEEAAFGDPAIDVGYCRMNMLLRGMTQAADEFLKTYEIETGREAANLAFWELAAAARPMIDPPDWEIDAPPGSDRFCQFIESALLRSHD